MRPLSAVLTTGFLVIMSLTPARSMTASCPGIAECTPLEVFDTHVRDRKNDATAFLVDLNAKRAAIGLPPLVEDARLDRVARAHAVDMVANRYFAHMSPDGKTPFARMEAAGIGYGYAGENIAHDVDGDTANKALWASPPHRANRLEPHFAHVGIVALATDGAGELIVEDFTD